MMVRLIGASRIDDSERIRVEVRLDHIFRPDN